MHTKSTNKELFKRLIVRLILALLIVLFLFYLLPEIVHLLFPILFAAVIAALVNPIVDKMNKWFRRTQLNPTMTRHFIALFMTFFILIVIFLILYFSFSTLISEIIGLTTSIQENWENIVSFFEDIEQWLQMQVVALPEPILDVFENITESILTFIQNFSSNLLSYTVSFTGLLISRTGSFTLNLITFFLALYFILSDFKFLTHFITQRMNKRFLKSLNLLKDSAVFGVLGYVKTQVILAFIAFIFMFVSLTLYDQPYSFMIALVIALVDVLPLLGTMAVILPWGSIELISGDINKGLFILLLGVLFFILRRIIEPKIMGTQTGLHPLLTLIGIYAGIQYSGLWGALLGPLIMIIVVSLFKSGALDNTVSDLTELYHKTALLLNRNESI